MNKITGRFVFSACFYQLLRPPVRRRVSGHSSVHDLTRLKMNDEEPSSSGKSVSSATTHRTAAEQPAARLRTGDRRFWVWAGGGIVRLIGSDLKNLQLRTLKLQVDATRPGRRLGLV